MTKHSNTWCDDAGSEAALYLYQQRKIQLYLTRLVCYLMSPAHTAGGQGCEWRPLPYIAICPYTTDNIQIFSALFVIANNK